jgi:hypothetical protein
VAKEKRDHTDSEARRRRRLLALKGIRSCSTHRTTTARTVEGLDETPVVMSADSISRSQG